MATGLDTGAVAGVPIYTAGVDWLTITAPEGTAEKNLREIASEWTKIEEAGGNDQRPFTRFGYRGWTCGGVSFGRRHDGAMVVLSGGLAAAAWEEVLPRGHNVTRLDVQVTIDGGPLCTDLALVHDLDVQEASLRRGRPTGRFLGVKDGVSQTLYLGSRQSEKYFRCYDKHAENGDDYPPGAWRYEAEFKGDTAGATAHALFDADRRLDRCISLVHREFSSRGVRPLFAPKGVAPLVTVLLPLSDTERRLKWLRNQVSGTVQKLMTQVGEEAVWDALMARAVVETEEQSPLLLSGRSWPRRTSQEDASGTWQTALVESMDSTTPGASTKTQWKKWPARVNQSSDTVEDGSAPITRSTHDTTRT